MLQPALNAVLTLVALLALVPGAVLFAQVAAALLPRRIPDGSCTADGKSPRIVVLMPAHNESSVIVPTLRGILPALRQGDRVVVVADNCSDDTAALAAAEGAAVVERHNLTKRGKSHALEYGIGTLAADPPDVVIVIDADCQVEPGTIERIAHECQRTGRPVQSLYLMAAQKASGLSGNVAEFAWIVKNWVRPLGMRNLGLACQLMGTGTAFPWKALHGFPVGNTEMAEDYKFGLDLARSGYPPMFDPSVRVRSSFPTKPAAELSQRTRWEHGHLQLIWRDGLPLLGTALRRGDLRLLGLAADMLVPPLVFLALMIAAGLALAAVGAVFGLSTLPLHLASAAFALFFLAATVAWLGWGRSAIPVTALWRVPIYVLAKLPIYLRFVTRRQRVWLKTERD
jgi:cellulose synthase/poly-beta-1,6-N-acetylglucosamine synthase-like glycosyltransferase